MIFDETGHGVVYDLLEALRGKFTDVYQCVVQLGEGLLLQGLLGYFQLADEVVIGLLLMRLVAHVGRRPCSLAKHSPRVDGVHCGKIGVERR